MKMHEISNAGTLTEVSPGRSTGIIKTLKDYIKYRYLFILFIPAVIFYLVFCYAPMYGIIIAFKDYRFIDGIIGSPWAQNHGMANFIQMFKGPGFINVFTNTIILSFYKLIFGFPAPIILALLLNELRNGYFKRIVQTISYLPHFLSWVILSGIVIQFLSPSIGPLGYIMQSLGLRPINFIGETRWFRMVLVGTSLWKEVGWGTIVYLASMAGINPEIYEAAMVDGASRFKRIIYITLPSLVPVATFIFTLNVGSIINDDFDQIFNLSNAAVLSVADVISTYTYRTGLVEMNYSYSAAVGLFKNVISIALLILTDKIIKKSSDNEYGLF